MFFCYDFLEFSDNLIDPVLELLEEHGYIYTEVPPYLGVGRPPAVIVHVNPKVLEDE